MARGVRKSGPRRTSGVSGIPAYSGGRARPHPRLEPRGRSPIAMPLHISIVEYNPQWPELYQLEAGRIRTILGSRVLRLEHIGSTSVSGLAAKPVVDMTLA